MAPSRAVEAGRYDHSFHGGPDLCTLCVYFVHIVDLIGLEFQPSRQKRLNIKGVFGVRIGCVFEIGVLGDVVLIRKEGPHTAQLEDALAAVHDGQLVLAHQLFAILSSDELEQKCSPFLQTEEGALTTYLDFNYYIVIFFSNSFLKSSILLASIKIGVIEEKTTGFLE